MRFYALLGACVTLFSAHTHPPKWIFALFLALFWAIVHVIRVTYVFILQLLVFMCLGLLRLMKECILLPRSGPTPNSPLPNPPSLLFLLIYLTWPI
ncbi:hypothetical protein V2J09_017365 [Rumex salicifolius]